MRDIFSRCYYWRATTIPLLLSTCHLVPKCSHKQKLEIFLAGVPTGELLLSLSFSALAILFLNVANKKSEIFL
jgi:hypothetical protein